VTYWEKFNGELLFSKNDADEGEINALAITKNGEFFMTGGEETVLKIWGYNDKVKYF
jgi:hypothetical protein